MKSEAFLYAAKATEALWRANATAVEVTHAAERRAASVKLEESNRNEAVQRARATSAEKASAVLLERMRKVMPKKDRLTVRCDELGLEIKCSSGFAKGAKEGHKLRVEVQHLKKKRIRSAGSSRSVSGKNWLTELEVSLAIASEMLTMVGGPVKILDADVQESELQRASIERKCHELMVESAGHRSKLQMALLRVSELENNPSRQVFVNPSVESEMVAALKTQIAALWSQVKTMKDESGARVEAVNKRARIGGRVIVMRGELLS